MTTSQKKSWSWSNRESVVCGVTAALTFASSYALGSAITAALGPGMSGFVTITITTMMVVFGAKIADKPGALLMIGLVFSLLAIPTTIFGPPGIHKVGIGLVIGVLYEFIVWICRRRDFGYVLASGISSIGAIFAILALLQYLDPQTALKLKAVVKWIWAPYGLLGITGGWLGVRLFHSLKHLRPIQGLMNDPAEPEDQSKQTR